MNVRSAVRSLTGGILFGMALVTALLFLPVRAQEVEPSSPGRATISDRLAAQLEQSQGVSTTFLVILKDQLDLSTLTLTGTTQSRAAVLHSALTSHAISTQTSLRDFLDGEAAPYRPFYIVNMLEVTGDAALAEALRDRPEVDRLAANPPSAGVDGFEVKPLLTLPKPARRGIALSSRQQELKRPWGIDFTNAPAVWAQGYTGKGIVIASQDTGVDWQHPALLDRYRGWDSTTLTATHEYNWFDAFGLDGITSTLSPTVNACSNAFRASAQVPCDDYGHGTHTVGTLLGDASAMPLGLGIIGMAPDAQWMACRNMDSGVGTPGSYATCFQFFLAPYPQDGDPFTDGRPDLAPHIINNSWGCPISEGCDDPNILRQVVETSRAAGQMVVASAGNSGSFTCSTVDTPIGTYDAVFTVGAHGSSGQIAGFSSIGPVSNDGSGRQKPDLTAPGMGVVSAYPGGELTVNQGTSMASPHVAGTVALLWSANPSLIGDIETTEYLIRKSADHVYYANCQLGAMPNATFGYGRLDALATVVAAQASAPLTVSVTSPNGEPHAAVPVTFVDGLFAYSYTVKSSAAGLARLPIVFTVDESPWSTVITVAVVSLAGDPVVNSPISLFDGQNRVTTNTDASGTATFPVVDTSALEGGAAMQVSAPTQDIRITLESDRHWRLLFPTVSNPN